VIRGNYDGASARRTTPTMAPEDARSVAFAINRYVRRRRIGEGGRSFGVEYVTWHICHPQLSTAFNAAIEVLTG
jgi:hypothetical protein